LGGIRITGPTHMVELSDSMPTHHCHKVVGNQAGLHPNMALDGHKLKGDVMGGEG